MDRMTVTCTTCRTEFDATVRCPECRQAIADPVIAKLAALTKAIVDNAPPALAKAIFVAAK